MKRRIIALLLVVALSLSLGLSATGAETTEVVERKSVKETFAQITPEAIQQLKLIGFYEREWTVAAQSGLEWRYGSIFYRDGISSRDAFEGLARNILRKHLLMDPYRDNQGRDKLITRAEAAVWWMLADQLLVNRPVIIDRKDIQITDITNHPLREAIIYGVERGYFGNTARFNPNALITNHEVMVLTLRAVLSDVEIAEMFKKIDDFQKDMPYPNPNRAHSNTRYRTITTHEDGSVETRRTMIHDSTLWGTWIEKPLISVSYIGVGGPFGERRTYVSHGFMSFVIIINILQYKLGHEFIKVAVYN
jgi:hypothetical protein